MAYVQASARAIAQAVAQATNGNAQAVAAVSSSSLSFAIAEALASASVGVNSAGAPACTIMHTLGQSSSHSVRFSKSKFKRLSVGPVSGCLICPLKM